MTPSSVSSSQSVTKIRGETWSPAEGRTRDSTFCVFTCQICRVGRLLILLAHGGLEAQLRLGPSSSCPNNSETQRRGIPHIEQVERGRPHTSAQTGGTLSSSRLKRLRFSREPPGTLFPYLLAFFLSGSHPLQSCEGRAPISSFARLIGWGGEGIKLLIRDLPCRARNGTRGWGPQVGAPSANPGSPPPTPPCPRSGSRHALE